MEYGTIALMTDFGLSDPYVGVMKGVIASINPNAPVIDITHGISNQNVAQAAFILKKIYHYFPTGTIFTAVIDPGVGTDRAALAVKAGNYFFIAPDNGLLAPILSELPEKKIIRITNQKYFLTPVSSTFHGRDIFAPAAAHISHSIPMERLGEKVFHYQGLDFPEPVIKRDYITGHVIFADHFGNLVTDLEKDLIKGEKIHSVRIGNYVIKGLNSSYSQSSPGELLSIIGSYDTLEISVNRGSAKKVTGIGGSAPVEIWFRPGQLFVEERIY